MRSGRVTVGTVLLVLVVLAAIGWGVLFGPYYWDAVKMKEVVQNTAIAWESWDLAKGKERLTAELREKQIPTYVLEEDCEFLETLERKTVRCTWVAIVPYPLVDAHHTLEFTQEATVDPNGKLVDD